MAKQKIVVKVTMENDKKSRKALKIAASLDGVESASFVGSDQIAVTGEGVDSVKLTTLLRKGVGLHGAFYLLSGVLVVKMGYPGKYKRPSICIMGVRDFEASSHGAFLLGFYFMRLAAISIVKGYDDSESLRKTKIIHSLAWQLIAFAAMAEASSIFDCWPI
ncbi:hypothetical protein Tco_0213026 [Tanacetum coccineum]